MFVTASRKYVLDATKKTEIMSKRNKIPVRIVKRNMEKGNAYANKRTRQLFTCIFALLAVVLLVKCSLNRRVPLAW